jgi:hypothetical protein
VLPQIHSEKPLFVRKFSRCKAFWLVKTKFAELPV